MDNSQTVDPKPEENQRTDKDDADVKENPDETKKEMEKETKKEKKKEKTEESKNKKKDPKKKKKKCRILSKTPIARNANGKRGL